MVACASLVEDCPTEREKKESQQVSKSLSKNRQHWIKHVVEETRVSEMSEMSEM
jgi:hypothetical protein